MKLLRLQVFLLGVIILAVFNSWFGLGLITAGDFWSSFNSMYSNRPIMLYAWDWGSGGGMGGFVGPLLWIYLNFGIPTTIFGKILGLNWNIVERLYYLFPFLGLTLFFSSFLYRKLISKNNFYLLSASIFLFNTYILMIVGGGQIGGIAIAYALLPLVLYSFIKLNENIKLKYSVLFGVLFGILVMFDLRIAYILFFALFILFLFNIKQLFFGKNIKEITVSIFHVFIVPLSISVLLHAFWILPILFSYQNSVQSFGSVFISMDAVKFFSFADFSNSISLLHPNWPENIFGKVGFLKPEFIMLPILAFGSLLFIGKGQKSMNNEQRTRNYVLFFALLGLIGAFLAKGANEPFGGIYLWLFDHLPGFIMFRDPTKWYTLVAISYSILIPFTAWKIYEWLKSQPKFLISNFKFSIKSKIFNASNLFLLVIVFCLLYLIRPALLGQLSGTFKTTQISNDYIKLEKFLSSQNNFSRTLWVPTIQRFGFYSNFHPAIPAQDFFKTVDYSKIISKMKISEDLLQESAVKYVIVPYDSQGEIFLKDRKYDEKLYQEVVRGVSKIPWLKPVDCLIAKLLNCTGNPFGKIAVFEIDPPAGGPKDHFYISNQQSATRLPKPGTGGQVSNQKLTYQYISPVEYKLEVKNAKIGDIVVFSESYDKNWIAKTPNYTLYAKRYGLFNSFVLPKDGSYSLRVYYTPQDYVNIGMIVSGFSLILILSALVYLRKKKI